jgi:hypothetical protein
MKRKDFYKILTPLTDKIYSLAYTLIPDDLQAEQLVIDSVNAFIFKEKKAIQNKLLASENKKESQIFRRVVFKGIISHLSEIGFRRSMQLQGLNTHPDLNSFSEFFSLSPLMRLTIKLRFDFQFSVDEISDVLDLPRFEVIEKIHNAKHLLMNHYPKNELNLE